MLENSPFSSVIVWLLVSFYIIIILLLIAKLASYIAFKRAQGWLAHNKTLIYEYSASPDLTPVEFGYLFDRKFRDNELLALLISMHQKKIIKLITINRRLSIEKVQHKHPVLHLNMIELEVISFLNARGGSCDWSEFAKSMIAGNELHESYERFVHHELEEKGYFMQGSLEHYKQNIHNYQKWIGALISVAFVIFPVYQSFRYSQQVLEPGFAMVDQLVVGMVLFVIAVCFWPAWYMYVGLAAKIIYHSSGIPYGATKKLHEKWRILYGYNVFLHVVEKNRLSVDPRIDDKIMPWVVAAGIGPRAEKLETPKQ